METVTKKNLPAYCAKLAKKDKVFDTILRAHGVPPLWNREPGFATLIHIILEQQVSLAAALSAFTKLQERIGEVTPENLLQLNDAEMKACHFSRQKTGYARHLAEAVLGGDLDLAALQNLPDEEAKVQLMRIKGIGNWTADIYLLMALLRTDIMPKGDLALHIAYQRIKNLETRPSPDEFIEKTKVWKPYRSVAARLLWHFYLSGKKPN